MTFRITREHIIINGDEEIKNVNQFVYLGFLITSNYGDTKGIIKRLFTARMTMVVLTNIWKDRSVCYKEENIGRITTKKRLERLQGRKDWKDYNEEKIGKITTKKRLLHLLVL